MKSIRRMNIKFLLILLLGLPITSAFAVDYYVSALTGTDSNNGLTANTAFQTIQKAANLTNPGDTVFIMNGTYTSKSYNNLSILNILRSGSEGKYITYKAKKGHFPKIAHSMSVTFQVWNAVVIDASYVVFDGIEIEGNNASLNYNDGYQIWQNYENNIKDWVLIAKYNAGGISIGKDTQVNHVVVRNCKVHDAGGGIGGGKCDYITIENNLIYNNCWYSMYAGSGISILEPISIDNVTTHKIFIRNNIVHNNKTLVPWERINALSDGNGIILDVNNGSSGGSVYVGRYLVENNVSFNNGGGGVHAYKANHVDIINNTAYNNGTVVGYPEIDANQCSDVKIYNNIMYARMGGNCNGNDNATYDYNIYFNGPAYKKGFHDIVADPKFVQLPTITSGLADASTANFRLQTTSPALNNGSNVASQFSSKDILGIERPVGFSTDMGAYEYPTVIPRTEIAIKQGNTEIVDNTGTFDFGDVASTTPKIVTFTIENNGDLVLNLTGTPKVAVTGTGFSLETDAPSTITANSSATFQVKLTTTTVGTLSGTISISNDDANENPYNFVLTGYGYDGTKALQNITFNALPVKVLGDADFVPGATTTSKLTIAYTSSNAAVASITADGKIHIVSSGTSIITASQAGDANTNVAKPITQLLTVTPVIPPAGTNMITNPTFDTNLTGWSFANKNSATATVESVIKGGYTGNAIKLTTTAIGSNSGMDNIQYSINVFLVKDRNYLIQFKASADANRNISANMLMNASPWTTIFSKTVALTTSPYTFGTYSYTSTYTGWVAFRFFVGSNTIPVYIDDVQIVEEVLTALAVQETEANNQTDIKVYPNPATDLIRVDFSSKYGEINRIGLFDLQGRAVLQKEFKSAFEGRNSIEFDIQTVKSGVYFIRILGKNELCKTIKVVIQK